MSVQRGTTDELEQERPWEAHAWLRAETLAALAELNEDCLEMLAVQSASSSVHSVPLLARGRWGRFFATWIRMRGVEPLRVRTCCSMPGLQISSGGRGWQGAVSASYRSMIRRTSRCSRRARWRASCSRMRGISPKARMPPRSYFSACRRTARASLPCAPSGRFTSSPKRIRSGSFLAGTLARRSGVSFSPAPMSVTHTRWNKRGSAGCS